MSLLKIIVKILLVDILFSLTFCKISYADGGFPVRPGRLLISPSVSYFFSNSKWDSNGVKKPYAYNGKFSSIGLTLYSEYGISRRFAAVVSLPYVLNKYTQSVDPRNTTSTGFTDLETGLRYYLANIDFVYYFSLQGTAITPMYTNNNSLGYREEGAELKFAFSGSGHLFNKSSYFNVSNGVRQYFGSNGPIQDRYSGTFGVSLDNEFMNQVSVGVSGIYSVSNDKGFSPILETNKDFSFLQASLSYGHSFTREISLFASGGKFLTGRNTGAGITASLALIYRLDYR